MTCQKAGGIIAPTLCGHKQEPDWLFLHDMMRVRLQPFCNDGEVRAAVKEVIAQTTKTHHWQKTAHIAQVKSSRCVVLLLYFPPQWSGHKSWPSPIHHQNNPNDPTSDSPPEPWGSADALQRNHLTPPRHINTGMLVHVYSQAENSIHDENGWERDRAETGSVSLSAALLASSRIKPNNLTPTTRTA